MSSLFGLLFFVGIIWFFFEWRKNRKNGLKLQKKGKWLLVLSLLFVIGATTTADADDKSSDTSQKQSKASRSSKKSSSSKKSDSKKSSDNSSSNSSDKKSVQEADGILTFTGKKQHAMGDLDSLKRATYSHIQLQDKDEPKKKRSARLTYNPVGWHNFKFYYGDGSKQAWLMNRGHLVGYQFSGLNDEPKNLVPETAWMNAGNYKGMNDGNKDSMLYYENRLDYWLANHPHYWLDYQVKPIYQEDELVPRQVALSYVGLDSDGKVLEIKLGSDKESVDAAGITHVTLDNVSPNAQIDYLTGRATNMVDKESHTVSSSKSKKKSSKKSSEKKSEPAQQAAAVEQPAQNENAGSSRTVYVTGGGKSNVYWYDTSNMPARTNKANIITMTEADAIAQGKRLSNR
ncbi:DNA/RNA non-specific endonuclease [Fructobacillus sp. CRL 2054]|uniref:DNA/RNA non-specific endonuclease n=1 Tax=Fructobacillus sp. CRL 2054 TaxID=2763007 RepID=UPI0023786BCC|nr:DNA/RNA non-specific endonuclease [Fructobacillus sp. CRL 2054]MDD9138599.1 DNA/RNA non-specific endonuclease [Fructobacillus sp. CRL 2054]